MPHQHCRILWLVTAPDHLTLKLSAIVCQKHSITWAGARTGKALISPGVRSWQQLSNHNDSCANVSEGKALTHSQRPICRLCHFNDTLKCNQRGNISSYSNEAAGSRKTKVMWVQECTPTRAMHSRTGYRLHRQNKPLFFLFLSEHFQHSGTSCLLGRSPQKKKK